MLTYLYLPILFMQRVADEAAGREVDLGFPQQRRSWMMQKAREHQPKGDLVIDARPSARPFVPDHLLVQPGEVEDPVTWSSGDAGP